MPDADEPRKIPINELRQDDAAHDLATSPDMKPYLDLITAQMQGDDGAAELAAIRALPLEKRYVWRVASALKWAFADLETDSIAADRQTLAPEDLAKIMDMLKLRPMQMCIFLAALVGPEEMLKIMKEAVRAGMVATKTD